MQLKLSCPLLPMVLTLLGSLLSEMFCYCHHLVKILVVPHLAALNNDIQRVAFPILLLLLYKCEM